MDFPTSFFFLTWITGFLLLYVLYMMIKKYFSRKPIMVRTNYSRCLHRIIQYLKIRCKHHKYILDSKKDNYDTFQIRQEGIKPNRIVFQRNITSRSFVIDDLVEVQNEHLLAFYNSNTLFKLLRSLKELRENSHFNILIIKNEIVIKDLVSSHCDQSIFEKLSKLKIPKRLKDFRIQIAGNNMFAFNRCLRISTCVFNALLENDSNNKVFIAVIELASLYFECFCIPSTCARMQSLAHDASKSIHESFSFLHINKYLQDYIQMSKLLFPFLANIDQQFLLNRYLEILPAMLIRTRKPNELVRNFQELQNLEIEFFPSKICCIESFIFLSYATLVSLDNPKKFISALKKLEGLDTNKFKKHSTSCFFPSEKYVEYDKVFSSENGSVKLIDVENVPNCNHQSCNIFKNFAGLYILHHTGNPLIAMEQKIWLKMSKKEKTRFQVFLKEISECFRQHVPFAVDPISKTASKNTFLSLFSSKMSFEAKVEFSKTNSFILTPISDRFFISTDTPLEFTEGFKYLFEELSKIEKNEGICLSYINGLVETIEHFEQCTKKWEFCERTVTDCFHNAEDDLQKFFDILSKEDLDGISFRISTEGFICFDTLFIIRPTTFLKVQNKSNFLSIIKQFSKFQSSEYLAETLIAQEKKLCHNEEIMRSLCIGIKSVFSTFSPYWSVETSENDKIVGHNRHLVDWKTCEDKKVLVEIAKLLNPKITNLKESWYKRKNFLTLPFQVFCLTGKNKFSTDLSYLKKEKICYNEIPYGPVWGYVFNSVIHIPYDLDQHVDYSNFPNFLNLIEDVLYDLHFRAIISNSMLVLRIDSFLNFCEDWGTKPENQQLLKTIFKKIDQLNPFAHVVFSSNTILTVNFGIGMHAKIFEMLSQQNMKNILEAASLLYRLKEQRFPNDWISIMNEKSEKTKPFVGAKGFSLVDTKEETYLEIGKLLQPNLQYFQNDELLSFKCLKLLPQKFISHEPSTLLKKLIEVKDANININSDICGRFCIGNISLITSQLLCCKNMEVFKLINNVLANLMEKTKILKNKQTYFLHPTGSLTGTSVCNETIKMEFKKELSLLCLKWLNKIPKSEQLPLILNSEGFLQIGRFVWFHISECPWFILYFYEIAKSYDNSIESPSEVTMRSIKGLTGKAKNLAKILNPLLEDTMFSDLNIKVFPNDLFNLWQNNPDSTYKRVKNALKELRKLNLKWIFTLNGFLFLENCFMLTITQLLAIKDFSHLQKLTKLLSQKYPLLCEEEIKYGKNKENRLNLAKLPSHLCIQEAKHEADKIYPKRNRIEPNGTLILNENIWVHPQIFLDETNRLQQISSAIKNIFKDNNFRFQYGQWNDSVVTSIFKTRDENIYDYCNIFCAYAEEYDSKISIKYYAERIQFKFNECIFIHPRSFFHLQNIEGFVKALRKYSNDLNNDAKFIDDLVKASKEERKKEDNLWEVQSRERIEYDYVRKHCFRELGKILLKNSKENTVPLPIINNQVVDDSQKLYNLEKIEIQNELIFTKGVTTLFVNVDKNQLALNYNKETVLVALKLAIEIKEEYKCINLFDYHSLLESIQEYCEGKHVINDKMKKTAKSDPKPSIIDIATNSDPFNVMQLALITEMGRVKVCQNKFKDKLTFSNTLKGLHHWFKHGEDYNSLDDYYDRMNNFFHKCNDDNVERELDTQDGLKLIKNYQDRKCFGSLVFDEENPQTFVATFYKKKRNETLKFQKFNQNNCKQFLVFTDIMFPKDYVEVSIDEKIMVCENSLEKIIKVIQKIPKNVNKVEKVIFLLSDNKSNQPATKSTLSKNCKILIEQSKLKFKNESIQIIFHHNNALDVKKELETENIDMTNVEFSDDKIDEKNNEEWKKLIESKLIN